MPLAASRSRLFLAHASLSNAELSSALRPPPTTHQPLEAAPSPPTLSLPKKALDLQTEGWKSALMSAGYTVDLSKCPACPVRPYRFFYARRRAVYAPVQQPNGTCWLSLKTKRIDGGTRHQSQAGERWGGSRTRQRPRTCSSWALQCTCLPRRSPDREAARPTIQTAAPARDWGAVTDPGVVSMIGSGILGITRMTLLLTLRPTETTPPGMKKATSTKISPKMALA